MKYSRFEDLPCWQKARELCQAVFKVINRAPFSKDFGLKDRFGKCGLARLFQAKLRQEHAGHQNYSGI